MEILAIILFISIFLLILYGYPVAFTLGGISIIYALLFLDPVAFTALPPRIMGVVSNYVLLAVPLFIYMGIMLEKSGLAESLLETMAILFGKLRGGLAISVVIVGALLAASTGIVGATVITMGLADEYYGDTLKLLSLIAMSGNWWTPAAAPCPDN